MKYRNNQVILGKVLECTESKIGISEIISKSNTNYGRIKPLLLKLVDSEMLIKIEKEYVITEKGRVYLETWRKFHSLSQSFGLEL